MSKCEKCSKPNEYQNGPFTCWECIHVWPGDVQIEVAQTKKENSDMSWTYDSFDLFWEENKNQEPLCNLCGLMLGNHKSGKGYSLAGACQNGKSFFTSKESKIFWTNKGQ